MSAQELAKKIDKHKKILEPILSKLREALTLILNERDGTKEFVSALEELRLARQTINNEERAGFVLSIYAWSLSVFPLSLDPDKDQEQIPFKLPPNKIN